MAQQTRPGTLPPIALDDIVSVDPPASQRPTVLAPIALDDVVSVEMPEPAPKLPKPTFSQTVGRGIDQMQSMLYGGVEAAGEAAGIEGVRQFGAEGRQRNEAEAAKVGRTSLADIHSASDFGDWVKETIGEQIPMMAPSIAGGVAGAAVGSVVPVVGTALGAVIGAFIPSFAMGVGEVQSSIKQKDPNAQASGWAFAGGTAIAALDTALPGKIGSQLVRKFGREVAEEIAARTLLTRVAAGGTSGMTTEGVTEAMQAAIGEVAAAKGTGTPVNPDLAWQMLEEGAAGALMGGLAGGASAAAPDRQRSAPAPIDPADIVDVEPAADLPLQTGATPPPAADLPMQPDAAAATPPAAPPAQPPGVPFMITRAMVADLRARGVSEQEIGRMTPQQAWDRLQQPAEAAPEVTPDIAPIDQGVPQPEPSPVQEVAEQPPVAVEPETAPMAGVPDAVPTPVEAKPVEELSDEELFAQIQAAVDAEQQAPKEPGTPLAPVEQVAKIEPGGDYLVAPDALTVDPQRFAPQASVDDDSAVLAWKDPETGRVYVTAGHEQIAQARQQGAPKLRVKMLAEPPAVTKTTPETAPAAAEAVPAATSTPVETSASYAPEIAPATEPGMGSAESAYAGDALADLIPQAVEEQGGRWEAMGLLQAAIADPKNAKNRRQLAKWKDELESLTNLYEATYEEMALAGADAPEVRRQVESEVEEQPAAPVKPVKASKATTDTTAPRVLAADEQENVDNIRRFHKDRSDTEKDLEEFGAYLEPFGAPDRAVFDAYASTAATEDLERDLALFDETREAFAAVRPGDETDPYLDLKAEHGDTYASPAADRFRDRLQSELTKRRGEQGTFDDFDLGAKPVEEARRAFTADNLETVFGLDYTEAAAAIEIAEAMDLDFEKIKITSGGTPGVGALPQSEAFRRWFGDSKVVDAQGQPLVVYHGTDRKFDAFDPGTRGSVTGSSDSKVAFWFTASEGRAYDARHDAMRASGNNMAPAPLKVYLKVENPLIIEEPLSEFDPAESARLIRRARRAGHDGVIFAVGEHGAADYAIFEPTQIKSVDNRGTFDPSNPNILYQGAEKVDGLETVGSRGAVVVPFSKDLKTFLRVPTRQDAERLGTDETVDVSDLVATQDRIDPAHVKRIIAGQWPADSPPIGVRRGDKVFLVDGHHRAAAQWAQGQTQIRVRVVREMALRSTPTRLNLNGAHVLSSLFKSSDVAPPDLLRQGEKAAVEFAAGGVALMRAMRGADVSSAVHELAHIARRFLFDVNIPADQRAGITDDDIFVAAEWAGATRRPGGEWGQWVWSREAEEKFARGFERYLADGIAPTRALKTIFEQFKEWLGRIYQQIAASSIDIEISSEMRAVYDKLVTRKAARERAEAAATGPKISGMESRGAAASRFERGDRVVYKGQEYTALNRDGDGLRISRPGTIIIVDPRQVEAYSEELVRRTAKPAEKAKSDPTAWMNEGEIEEAVARFKNDPVLGPAARFLEAFKDEVNRHSDGWPYWHAPSKAAGQLQTLIHGHLRAGMGAYPRREAPTAADVWATMSPIQSFMTRRGTAAGMKLPALDLPKPTKAKKAAPAAKPEKAPRGVRAKLLKGRTQVPFGGSRRLAPKPEPPVEEPPKRKYASTQINLPPEAAGKVRALAATIDDKELAEDGREETPHVTVQYGLHSDDAAAVQKALADQELTEVTIGGIGIFKTDEADVVYLKVHSLKGLERLRESVRSSGEVTDTHPEYTPHVTLAYVTKGRGDVVRGALLRSKEIEPVTGLQFTADSVVFSPAEGDPTTIPLNESATARIFQDVGRAMGAIAALGGADKARAAIDEAKAKNAAERDEILAQLRAKLNTQVTTGVDPELGVLMIKLVRTYIKDGILEFRLVALNVQEALGPAARTLDRHLELAWQRLRNETVSVADALAQSEADGRSIGEDGSRGTQPTDDSGGLGSAEPGPRADAQDDAQTGRPAGGSTRPSGRRAGGRRAAGTQPGAGAGTGAGQRGAADAVEAPAGGAPGPVTTDGNKPSNYRITDQDNLGVGGPATKFKQNIAAIKLAKTIAAENRPATADEQRILVKFVGWGGLKKQLDEAQYELRENGTMTHEEYHRAFQSSLNAHYTTPDVIRAMWAAVQQLGFERGRVLEPSMGIGHFIGLAPADVRATQVAGIELDPLSGLIGRLLYPQSKIQVTGFQDASLPADYFDLAISNVPFGKVPVADPASKIPGYVRARIHNYFFAKALQKVRPGGLIAFITTHGTLDAGDGTPIRGYLGQHADFLGAVRLPDTAFKANASTEVVTDIILMRRRAAGEADRSLFKDWIQTDYSFKSKDNPQGITVSKYFLAHPERVIGTMAAEGTMYGGGGQELSVKYRGDDVAEQAAAALTGLVTEINNAGLGYRPAEAVAEPRGPSEVAPTDIIEQMFYLDEAGEVRQRVKGHGVLVPLDGRQQKMLKGYIAVRDAFRQLVAIMRDPDAKETDVVDARGPLHKAYDKFVNAYGPLHKAQNAKTLLEDAFGPSVLAIETWDPETETADKAPIFTKRTINADVRPDRADSPAHALSVSLTETGGISWPRIASLLATDIDTAKQQLLDAGRVFELPNGSFEITERYLSGRVRDKLAEARRAADYDAKFQTNVDALEKVQPVDLGPDRISVHLGAPWVPLSVLTDFFRHLGGNLVVRYRAVTAEWAVTESTRGYYGKSGESRQWETDRVDLRSILDHTLNNKQVIVRDRDGKMEPKPTVEAQQKQEAVRKEFHRWAWLDSERANTLIHTYNQAHNATVLAKYDGSHLTLPGMANVWRDQLRPHQINAIWRAILEGNTYLGHTMGAGKTVVFAAIAMEYRRLGLARKPVIVIPKQTLSDYAKFADYYPQARVLIGTKEQTDGPARKQFMARIATGDYDAIVITRDAMVRMPAGLAAWNEYLTEQIEELRAAASDEELADLDRGQKKRGRLSDLARSIERLEQRQEEVRKKIEARKDEGLAWEDLGVDMLLVDEAHNYRKMTLATQIRDVAGVPTGGPSQRADDLFIKARQIQKATPGRNLVFGSGTPLVNSVAELYILQRFLQPEALKIAGVEKFDAWAATFGHIVTKYEADITGTRLKLKRRFSEFANLNGLIQTFRSVMDVMLPEDLNLPTPPVTGGAAKINAVDAGPALKAFIKGLATRVEKLDPRDRKSDNMLKISTDGRKAALDLRLVNIPPGGHKLAAIADRVLDTYQQWDRLKGTQLVFMEFGTPGGAMFSTYDVLKRLLVKGGMRPEQIAFIQDAGKSDAKRDDLMAKMRAGEIRVLIGPRETMGTGVNVQKRLVAMHHADPHWLPALIEQADGRGIRQGNTFFMHDSPERIDGFTITIEHYVTKGSFDAFMWQAVAWKGKMINQALRGNLSLDRIEEIGGGAVFNAAEIAAIGMDNPVMMERMQLEQTITQLQIGADAHLRASIDRQRDLIEKPKAIAHAEAALKTLAALQLTHQDPAIQILGETYTDLAKANKAIREKFAPIDAVTDVLSLPGGKSDKNQWGDLMATAPIGYIGPTPLLFSLELAKKGDAAAALRLQMGQPVGWVVANGVETGSVSRLIEQIGIAFGFTENRLKGQLDRDRASLAEAQRNKDLVFADQAELDAAKKRLQEIYDELGKTTSEAQPADEPSKDDDADTEAEYSDSDNEASSWMSEASARESAESEDRAPRPALPAPTTAVIRARGGEIQRTAHPVEFPELVELARVLIDTPQIVKAFRKDGKLGEFRAGLLEAGIRIHADLFKKGREAELAEVLAHEIGHLIDWLPSKTLKRGNLIGRLYSLRSFLQGTFTDPDGATIKNKAIRAELLAFSDAWRPWDRTKASASFKAYRQSSKELYADALSGLFANPGFLEATAPTFYAQFFKALDEKPDVKLAYFGLMEILSGTREELVARRHRRVLEGFGMGETKALDLQRQKIAERQLSRTDWWQRLKIQALDKHIPFQEREQAAIASGRTVLERPSHALSERNYVGGKLRAFAEREIQPVYKRLQELGVSWHEFGAAVFYERVVAGDRQELANPYGFTPASAAEANDQMRARWTAQQRAYVEGTAIPAFRRAVHDLVDQSFDAGLLTTEKHAEMKKNPAYAAFQIVEYMEAEISAKIYRQKGTLREVANPADATYLKMLATIRAIERQKTLTTAFDFLHEFDPASIEQAKEVWNGKARVPVEPKDRDTRTLVYYYEQGRLRGKYVDKYIGDSLNNLSEGQNNAIVQVLRLVNGHWFRPVFTTMNLGFQSFNLMRDFLRFYTNAPTMTLARAVRRYWQAIPMAKVRAFGLSAKPSAAELRAWEDLLDTQEAQILDLTWNDQIRGRTVEDTQIDDILARLGVGQFGADSKRSGAYKAFKAVLDWIEAVGNFIETLPKAAGVYEMTGRTNLADGNSVETKAIGDLSSADRAFLREKIGSPDFRAGGTYKPILNEVLLFANAFLQGTRSDLQIARDPKTRAEFWWKVAKISILPTMATFAATQLLGALDDDDEGFDDWLQRAYRNISEYDLTNYNCVPLWITDTGETVYIRLPLSDFGRLMRGLTWKTLGIMRGDQESMKSILQVFDYMGGQGPSASPALGLPYDLAQLARGGRVYDHFRDRFLFTEDEASATGAAASLHRLKKFAGYEFQELGGGVFWKFYPGESRPRDKSTGQKILEAPAVSNILGRWIKISSYGQTERMRRTEDRIAGEEARGRQAEQKAVNEAIREFRALPAAEQTEDTQRRLTLDILDRLYADVSDDERNRQGNDIFKKLRLGVIRGSGDPVADKILSARSNAQKAEILAEQRDQMGVEAFNQWMIQAVEAGVVSEPLAEEVWRRLELGTAR